MSTKMSGTGPGRPVVTHDASDPASIGLNREYASASTAKRGQMPSSRYSVGPWTGAIASIHRPPSSHGTVES
jgi:hypothetical protein